MKRLLSFLLTIIMLMTLGTAAFADYRGTVDGIEMKSGFNPVARVDDGTFDYVIYARDMSGMENGDLTVTYDTSALTLEKIRQVGNYTNSVYNDIGGEILFSFTYNQENTSDSVKMYILTFSYTQADVYPELTVNVLEGTFIKSVKDLLVVEATDDNAVISQGVDINDPFMLDDEEYRKGDVNGDDKVTAADARIVLRIAAKLETPSVSVYLLADFNGDGNITANDARSILRKAAKLS